MDAAAIITSLQRAVPAAGFEEAATIDLHPTIYVTRDSHKKIVIGEGGQMLKSIGAAARKDIMEATEARAHLFLFVKVRENWADDPERYREMGLEFPRG